MDALTFNKELGLVIRRLRKRKHMTQAGLSEVTGFSRATIANIEAGRQALTAHRACVLAKFFEFDDLNDFFPSDTSENKGMSIKLHSIAELSSKQRSETEALIANVKS